MAEYAIPLLAAGGAWGGASVVFRNNKEDIRDLKTKDAEQDVRIGRQSEALARIEAKQDMLLDFLRK